MRRIIYLAYYFKKLDWNKFRLFMSYVSKAKRVPRPILLIKVLHASLKYNISLLEYFQFRFYDLNHSERLLWAGTGYMYGYQKIMNPVNERIILDDKTLFYKNYKQFVKHSTTDLTILKNDKKTLETILSNNSGKIVFKVADGKCGVDVLIRDSEQFTVENISSFMNQEGYDLVEEFITQHPDLMELSPSAVNTIRIFTQLNDRDEVEILGCRLRISVNSSVDNMAAGNLAAPINEVNGTVVGPGVYSDITKHDEKVHPVSGVEIEGFKIPYWEETMALVKAAAKFHPQNRSIGWDIAMTENGPDLIEGNHDWCKLLWQLPVKQGLKPLLVGHLLAHRNKRKNN